MRRGKWYMKVSLKQDLIHNENKFKLSWEEMCEGVVEGVELV